MEARYMNPRKSYILSVAGTLPRREIAKQLGITPNALSWWCRKHVISMKLRFEYLCDDYKRQKAQLIDIKN